MAVKMKIVTQPMLVPNGSLNGEKLYRDYGWQWVWIYNADNTPPTVIKAGVTFSGIANDTYQPGDDGYNVCGEHLPDIRTMPFRRDEEPFGMVG